MLPSELAVMAAAKVALTDSSRPLVAAIRNFSPPELSAAACHRQRKLNPTLLTGGAITVNVISVPPNHFKCPDGNFRPDPEARALWDEYNAKLKSEGTPLLIGHSPSPEQGTVELEQQPQTIEPAAQPVKPVVEVLKPLSERDRIMARAKAMGYEPLPPRPHPEWLVSVLVAAIHVRTMPMM